MARGRSSTRSLARIASAILVGAAGAWLATVAVGALPYRLGPFTVELFARPGAPATTIAIPPLGEIRAVTHDPPVALTATLRSVEPDELNEALQTRGTGGVVILTERAGNRAVRTHAIRSLAVALAGSVAAALVVHRRDARSALAASVSGAVLAGTLAGFTWATYRPEAFEEPTYSGSLRLAPRLIGPIEQATARLEALRGELNRLVTSAAEAYGALAAQPAPSEDAVVVLHVSDMHASPLGMDFAQQIADTFDADLVIDTGDITSFGTPLEATMLDRIPEFQVPYVFVRGNHDSVRISAVIDSLPNGHALESEAVTVGGLTIFGASHPVFTPDPGRTYSNDEIVSALAEGGARLAEDVAALDMPPDIVAVHDGRMAAPLSGAVPLVLAGHFHRFQTEVDDEGTVHVWTASAGGGGLDTFLEPAPFPLAAQMLYLEGTPARLVALDRITLEPETRELRVQRQLLGDVGDGPIAPDAAGSAEAISPGGAVRAGPRH